MVSTEKIKEVLDEDLLRLEDIHACMVARKHLEGIVSIQKEHEKEISGVWSALERTMDEFFEIIDHYSKYGLDKIYFELGQYDVIFFILPETDTALVAIVPALANRGLLEVEMENARRRIMELL
jgi:predicted regulator of Ras-like GTPase activity (Roadblock/LC7/MglB family)